MSRVTSWVKTVLVGHKRHLTDEHLTDEQLNGDACALCGHRFFASEYRVDFGWIGFPGRRRAYVCDTECEITAVTEVEALFRSVIPVRQNIRFWSLGVDDMPVVAGPYFTDETDEEYVARVAAQPKRQVEIVHADGVLITGPLPQDYATGIAVQAQRLGFTAMVGEVAAR